MCGARAEELQPGATLSLDAAADLATRFYDQGRIKDATTIVRRLRPLPGVPAQIVFLSAHLYELAGNHAAACAEFRVLLAQHPELHRVRLDLARTLYLAGEYEQARLQFERVLAEDLPDPVRTNARAYLDAIRARTASYQVAASLVSDSNINQGPALEAIYLPGSVYTLGSDARSRSALGVWAAASGRLNLPDGEGVYLRGSAEEQSFGGSAFDFLLAQAGVGRRWGSGDDQDTAELSYLSSTLGSHALYAGPQVQLAREHAISRSVELGATLVARWLDYPNAPYLGGATVWLLPSVAWRPDSRGQLTLTAGAGYTDARDRAYGNVAGLLAAAWQRDFRAGLSVSTSVSVQHASYGAADPFFGSVRSDTLLQGEVGINRRDWVVLGLSPRIALRYTHNASNLPLYGFERRQLLVGATREF